MNPGVMGGGGWVVELVEPRVLAGVVDEGPGRCVRFGLGGVDFNVMLKSGDERLWWRRGR